MAFVTRGAEGQQTNFPASFSRRRLLAPKQGFSNVCGSSDGSSVDRQNGRQNSELLKRLMEFANRNAESPRTPEGYACANVGRLRSIQASDQQVVFVYDDPGDLAGPLHAVIRVSAVDAPTFLDVRDRIISEFKSDSLTVREDRDWRAE